MIGVILVGLRFGFTLEVVNDNGESKCGDEVYRHWTNIREMLR